MLQLSRAPHSDHRSEGFVSNPLGAVTRICVAFEHDKCGRARRMCRCEQRRWRECAVDRQENRLATA